MGEASHGRAARRLGYGSVRPEPRQKRLKRIPAIRAAQCVIHGVVKIVWDDGFEGVVDLSPTLDRGQVFAPLQDPARFRTMQVAEYDHSIGWRTEDGEVDLDSWNLRLKAENQAKLHQIVAALHP